MSNMSFIRRLYLSILLFFILKLNPAYSQDKTAESRDSVFVKQNMEFLSGFWQEDSTLHKIEFKIERNQLSLFSPDSYTYEFLRIDTPIISGVSFTWPPHDCKVEKIDQNIIEITYTLFGGQPSLVRYKRLNSK